MSFNFVKKWLTHLYRIPPLVLKIIKKLETDNLIYHCSSLYNFHHSLRIYFSFIGNVCFIIICEYDGNHM